MTVSIAHFLTHELIQKHKERIPNGKGGYLEDYGDPIPIRGRLNPATGRDLEIAHQKQAEVTHIIYLDPASDVRVNDQFLFGARSFRVTIPNGDTPSIPIYQKVFVLEVQRG